MDRDVFVVSDLHLGDASGRDKFEAGRKTPQLRAFLDHVGSEGGELYILGDLFELWQMNLSLLLVRRRELLDHLATLPLVYVPGNHDVDLAHFIHTDFIHHPFFRSQRGPFVRELGGRRFRFFHGHETDPFNAGDAPGFGRMLAIFAALFEEQLGSPLLAGGEAVGDVLEQFGDSMLTIWRVAASVVKRRAPPASEEVRPTAALTPAQDPDRLVEHVAGVRADREGSAYDVAVLGHTHKAGRIGDWYFNSGTWVGARNTFLRISPEGDVRYHEWKDGRAVEHAMPLVLPDAGPEPAAPAARNPFRAALSASRKLLPRPTKPGRSRWLLLLQGTLALALGAGVLAVSLGQGSSAGWRLLVSAFGAYALIDGVVSMVSAAREQSVKRVLSWVRGVASVLLGLLVFRRGYVVEIFVVLVGVAALSTGALRIAASVVFGRMVESRWLLIGGIGSVLAGLVLLFFPTSAVLLKIVLAAYLCYYGAGELLAGVFGPRRSRGGAAPARPTGSAAAT